MKREARLRIWKYGDSDTAVDSLAATCYSFDIVLHDVTLQRDGYQSDLKSAQPPHLGLAMRLDFVHSPRQGHYPADVHTHNMYRCTPM